MPPIKRYFLDTDNDGHWYLIPTTRLGDWDTFLGLHEDDEQAWVVPEWAQRLSGGANRVTFENPYVAD